MSASANWSRVRDLFHRALDLPGDERAVLVRREAADTSIREQVESLLAAHARAEGFLSHPAMDGDGSGQSRRFAPGTRLGAFEIVGLLGAGGMGEVYRARDTRLDRDVAIKLLPGELAADALCRERLDREARAVSRLTHPHICTLYDVGEVDVDGTNAKYLVMELIDGETLASRLLRGPLSTAQAMQIASQTLDALATAHAAGIIHRDLKPANIMLTKSGVKLLDFGVARLRANPRTGSPLAADADPLTPSRGLVFGTMPYMAPEQVRGEEADARSDLFAFGAVLYEMLSGRRAFAAGSEPALIAAILERDAPPLGVELPLERLVFGCLAKDPAERWQHARDVALALRTIAEGRPVSPQPAGPAPGPVAPTRRVWRVHAAWAAVAVLVSAAIWARDPRPADSGLPRNATPVIVLMDSPLEGRVYDPRTLAEGGTNADDITDALRGLPIVIHKENTSPMWHREEQVRRQNPDLIISHLSCLYDQRISDDATVRRHFFDMAQTRLVDFFGYVASVNPHTRFLVYSRGRFGTPEGTWSNEVLARFPPLSGRLFTLTVPGAERATFRDPAIMSALRQRVESILALRHQSS